MNIRNSWDLATQRKLSPSDGSVIYSQLNPTHTRGLKSKFLFIFSVEKLNLLKKSKKFLLLHIILKYGLKIYEK